MSESDLEQAPNPTPERFWFKVFNEMRTDLRFLDMSYEHQGIYINLLILANNTHAVGRVIAKREVVARALGLSAVKLDKALAEYEQKSLVFVAGETIQIADDRHYTGKGLLPSDSRAAVAERVRKSREAAKAEEEARKLSVTSNSYTSHAIEEEDQSSAEQRTASIKEASAQEPCLQKESDTDSWDSGFLGFDPEVPLE